MSFGLLLQLPSIAQQDVYFKEYEFINSIYRNHITKGLSFYYLYFKPSTYQFNSTLEDTLSNYLNYEEIQNIKDQFCMRDTSFVWRQDLLYNCRVIQGEKANEIRSKNTVTTALIVDADGRPINDGRKQEKIPIPIEEQQFFYFSKPIWNLDSSVAIFSTYMESGSHGDVKKYLYRKVENKWILIKKIEELEWNSY